MENPMIGKTIGHYKIVEKLGEGGMGVVYKALDTSLNRNVALKFLPSHLTQDESTRKRFVVEAQAASALDHPNICNIHEINETENGQLYICMAYYEGKSLNQKIKDGPIPTDQAIGIFVQILHGIQAAHEKTIIHRDIKPGNILINNQGDVKIVDFGLAKLAGMDLTKTTSSKGTAAYMSPEQIRGEKVDHRSDIWALGIVFYEILTDHLPFEEEYPEPMMYAIVNEEPISLSHYLKDVPDLLQSVIDKLLKKDPAERYQYITEILLDLEPLIKDSKILIVKQKSFFVKLFKMNKTYGIAAILVIAIILSLIIKFNFFTKQKLETSIAVLPLKNITQDTEQEWFSDGMTDALITELAQIRSLRVISRSSVMQFKEKNIPPPDIATKLGVQYLVDGSVTKTGDQVKISARLINAMDDEYIWAKEYDSIYKNILGIQSEIARSIANKIQVELTPSEKSRLSVTREVNPDTYEKYLKGMFFINKRTPEGVMIGIDYLNRAVETDPDEPLTHAGLSLGYSIIVHSPSPLEGSQERCKDEAMKALELDSTLAEAHLALAMIRIYGERNIAGAGESYRKALELNPNIPLAYMHYAWYMILTGKYEEAESCMEKAMQLDPLSPVYPADYAWVLFWNGHFDESVMSAQKSLELAPDFPYANFVLSQSYSEKEMHEAAIEAAKKATQFNTDFKWGLAYSHARAGQKEEALKIAVELESHLTMFNTWCLAVIYAALGDADKTFFWLEEAYHQHHPYIQWIKRWHGFNPYKQDPRYISLVDLMDLPE